MAAALEPPPLAGAAAVALEVAGGDIRRRSVDEQRTAAVAREGRRSRPQRRAVGQGECERARHAVLEAAVAEVGAAAVDPDRPLHPQPAQK